MYPAGRGSYHESQVQDVKHIMQLVRLTEGVR
jgi:hypothetical protein